MAKMARSSVSAVKYPPSDLYHDVTALCYKLWQADWDQRTGNKLYSVKPHLIEMLLFCEDCTLVILDFLTHMFSLEKMTLFALRVVVPLLLFSYSLNVHFALL